MRRIDLSMILLLPVLLFMNSCKDQVDWDRWGNGSLSVLVLDESDPPQMVEAKVSLINKNILGESVVILFPEESVFPKVDTGKYILLAEAEHYIQEDTTSFFILGDFANAQVITLKLKPEFEVSPKGSLSVRVVDVNNPNMLIDARVFLISDSIPGNNDTILLRETSIFPEVDTGTYKLFAQSDFYYQSDWISLTILRDAVIEEVIEMEQKPVEWHPLVSDDAPEIVSLMDEDDSIDVRITNIDEGKLEWSITQGSTEAFKYEIKDNAKSPLGVDGSFVMTISLTQQGISLETKVEDTIRCFFTQVSVPNLIDTVEISLVKPILKPLLN